MLSDKGALVGLMALCLAVGGAGGAGVQTFMLGKAGAELAAAKEEAVETITRERKSTLMEIRQARDNIRCTTLTVESEGIPVIKLSAKHDGGAIDLFHKNEPGHRITTLSTEALTEWGLNVYAPKGNWSGPIARMLGLLPQRTGISDLHTFDGG